MITFNSKKKADHYILTDNYVPAKLPGTCLGLENFITSDYPMNQEDVVKGIYHDAELYLEQIIDTCDHHFTGKELDLYIDNGIQRLYARHEVQVASNEHQIVRIKAAQEMCKEELRRKITSLEERASVLIKEIEPLEDLEPQFRIRIGPLSISVGLVVTVIAMIVDAFVNYGFLQSILLTNKTLLLITVLSMSMMSDFSMFALAEYLNHQKEHFLNRVVFWLVCFGFLGAFLLSVLGSVMIRFGSMNITFGSVNAMNEFVGKEVYSMAEYGIALVTAFVTTASGLLSFGLSLDNSAYRISIRERKKEELKECLKRVEPLKRDLIILANAPDPRLCDEKKRAAAVCQIEAIREGLKLHCQKLMMVRFNKPEFTERVTAGGGGTFVDNVFCDMTVSDRANVDTNSVNPVSVDTGLNKAS